MTGPPLTPDLLADLQAGLLDDDEAAELRQRIRSDPAARRILVALNQARSDVVALRTDTDSAPEVPAAAVDKVVAALRSETSPTGGSRAGAAHSVRAGLPPVRVLAAIAGVAAAVAAIALGTVALMHVRAPAPSAPVTAQHITVSSRPTQIPLSTAEILALLDRTPDYGALSDVARRSACLTGLGYPASARVLGAQPIEINGLPAVLLVLPGDTPDVLAVLAVSANCNSADTGLMTDTVVRRP